MGHGVAYTDLPRIYTERTRAHLVGCCPALSMTARHAHTQSESQRGHYTYTHHSVSQPQATPTADRPHTTQTHPTRHIDIGIRWNEQRAATGTQNKAYKAVKAVVPLVYSAKNAKKR